MEPSTGNLIVRTSTASQALPVPNATVTIFSDTDPEIPLDSSVTDESGQSKLFTLSAPPQEYSDSPNEPSAFSTYRVRVTHPSYSTVQIDGVSIFPGISSNLPVYLAPRIAGSDDSITYYVTTGPSGSGGANA